MFEIQLLFSGKVLKNGFSRVMLLAIIRFLYHRGVSNKYITKMYKEF
ncbi:hypothetical protein KGF42_14785 [Clostridioides sp. ZZV15-6383]|nr:hypothetical protein [Clostridioides sp. ZZV14-6345]MCC0700643.1 hypothetical protein [Clostridioides sp. ZZV15-6383]